MFLDLNTEVLVQKSKNKAKNFKELLDTNQILLHAKEIEVAIVTTELHFVNKYLEKLETKSK